MPATNHLLDVDCLPGRALPQLLDAIKAAGFAGANVTYPLKQEIIPLLDAVAPEAAKVGAVNTVANRAGWSHHRLQFQSPRLVQQLRGSPRARQRAGFMQRSRAFSQREFLDFAGDGGRQWPEHDRLWRLVVRESRPAMLDDLGFGRLRIRLELDEGAGRLAPFRIRPRHHGDSQHGRMVVDGVFHFQGRDVLTARNDHVLRAIGDLHVAIGMHDGEIP